MTIDTQPGDASFWHSKAMDENYTYTCIDCHKGFVHRLPDMAGEIKKAEEYFRTILAADTLTGDQLYTVMGVSLYSGSKVDDTIIAELELGTPITVLERNDDRLWIRIQGRQYQANKHTLYSMGNQMLVLLRTHGIPLTISGDTIRDEATGLYWQYAEMEGWISREGLSSDITSLWDYGEAIYQNGCIRCHMVFSPSDFWATQWRDYVRNMRCKTNFSPEQVNILLKYLEYHAKPQGVI
uniref:NapC/NirT cytochrome c family, N-terminal region n=1 Tax=Candidatus Kentrum sp. TUN TaxID=2126343 RepID=A0A450ZJT2_9GAMM|nr:MAG: NapC/NirT cytochrome c family, N-terminal region [Candidatus Kentron sp. TUN]VFK56087.1 MAG: NapC/NirT cytochrome c family, N-terminal region [Candidatus Kentron sp. TUN]